MWFSGLFSEGQSEDSSLNRTTRDEEAPNEEQIPQHESEQVGGNEESVGQKSSSSGWDIGQGSQNHASDLNKRTETQQQHNQQPNPNHHLQVKPPQQPHFPSLPLQAPHPSQIPQYNEEERAPDGPLQSLTVNLVETYRACNQQFKYTYSSNPKRVLTKPSEGMGNNGMDNADHDYILYVNDWIRGHSKESQYLVLDMLGQGTFGQVVKCRKKGTGEEVAVKVVKNKAAYFNQGFMEVKILEHMNKHYDPSSRYSVRLLDYFIFNRHLCMVFELLSINLYELLKQNQYRGLSISLVRHLVKQILEGLKILREARVIHCDLKPENILLSTLSSPQVKLIDFGSACFESQTSYTYIQSRFYRSPEVIVGASYTAAIDMWSLGCIAVELFLGLPIFPGNSEFNQLTRIKEMLGLPPDSLIEGSKNASKYFNVRKENGKNRYQLKTPEQFSLENPQVHIRPPKRYFKYNELDKIILHYPLKDLDRSSVDKEIEQRRSFFHFVSGLLQLDPQKRWTPKQAASHPFICQTPFSPSFVPKPDHDFPFCPQLVERTCEDTKKMLVSSAPTKTYMDQIPTRKKTVLGPGPGPGPIDEGAPDHSLDAGRGSYPRVPVGTGMGMMPGGMGMGGMGGIGGMGMGTMGGMPPSGTGGMGGVGRGINYLGGTGGGFHLGGIAPPGAISANLYSSSSVGSSGIPGASSAPVAASSSSQMPSNKSLSSRQIGVKDTPSTIPYQPQQAPSRTQHIPSGGSRRNRTMSQKENKRADLPINNGRPSVWGYETSGLSESYEGQQGNFPHHQYPPQYFNQLKYNQSPYHRKQQQPTQQRMRQQQPRQYQSYASSGVPMSSSQPNPTMTQGPRRDQGQSHSSNRRVYAGDPMVKGLTESCTVPFGGQQGETIVSGLTGEGSEALSPCEKSQASPSPDFDSNQSCDVETGIFSLELSDGGEP